MDSEPGNKSPATGPAHLATVGLDPHNPKAEFLRIKHIVGDPHAIPPIPPIIPVSRSTWWAGVASGRFPKPIKISPRITVWRALDIQALIEEICGVES